MIVHCIKCNGLMTPDDVYTEGVQPIKALRCMNCGMYVYAPLELRVLPVTEDARNKFKKFGTKRICSCGCGREFVGFRKKYFSQRCKDLLSIEKVRNKNKGMI